MYHGALTPKQMKDLLSLLRDEMSHCLNYRLIPEPCRLSRSFADSYPEAWAAIFSANLLVERALARMNEPFVPLM